MLTKIEQQLIDKGYVFAKEFLYGKTDAQLFAEKERGKENNARILNLRGLVYTVYVKKSKIRNKK